MDNNNIEALKRKYQITLICSGLAVILFGVWSIIRFLIERYMDPDEIIELIGTVETIPEEMYLQIISIIVICFLIVDLLIRFYMGTAAIKEGLGQSSKKSKYLIVIVLYVIINIYASISSIIENVNEHKQLYYTVFLLLDITTYIAFVEILWCKYKLRLLDLGMNKEVTGGGD